MDPCILTTRLKFVITGDSFYNNKNIIINLNLKFLIKYMFNLEDEYYIACILHQEGLILQMKSSDL